MRQYNEIAGDVYRGIYLRVLTQMENQGIDTDELTDEEILMFVQLFLGETCDEHELDIQQAGWTADVCERVTRFRYLNQARDML